MLVVVAFTLALSLKTYVAEAYEIKGRSMEPTFHTGERVVVLKSFFDIHRDDIIVFTSTEDPTKDLIKRVIGLPGETIRIAGKSVFINGRRVDEEFAQHGYREEREPPRETRVPEAHYYVMGDNRPDSRDSRSFQAIPANVVKGKVILRWWPFKTLRLF